MLLCQPCGATRLGAGRCCRPHGSLRSSPAGMTLSWCPASAAGIRMSHCSCRKAPQDLSTLAGLALVVFCWLWCGFFVCLFFVPEANIPVKEKNLLCSMGCFGTPCILFCVFQHLVLQSCQTWHCKSCVGASCRSLLQQSRACK